MNSPCIYIGMCITFSFVLYRGSTVLLGLFRFVKLPYSRIQKDGSGIIQEGGRDIGVGIAATFFRSPFVSSTVYLGTSKEVLFRCAKDVLSMPMYTDNCLRYPDQ